MSAEEEATQVDRERTRRDAAARRAFDRDFRRWLIDQGALVPGCGSSRFDDELEARVAALPALPLDAAGQAAAVRPVALDRHGHMLLEAANLAFLRSEERLAS